MNNPYRNGKTMSPQMTLLAMVFEAGARAALAQVKGALTIVEERVHWVVDEIEKSLPPPAPYVVVVDDKFLVISDPDAVEPLDSYTSEMKAATKFERTRADYWAKELGGEVGVGEW